MISSAGGTEVWQFTYTLMTQNVIQSNVSYVGSIAAKVTSGLVSASTVSNPTGGSWTTPAINTNANSSGCGGNGNGWVCIAWNSGAQLLTGPSAAASYSWVFDVTAKSGTILGTGSIQAKFDPATGVLLSENIHVPEGGHFELPILLCGLGLWMLIRARKKRFQAAN